MTSKRAGSLMCPCASLWTHLSEYSPSIPELSKNVSFKRCINVLFDWATCVDREEASPPSKRPACNTSHCYNINDHFSGLVASIALSFPVTDPHATKLSNTVKRIWVTVACMRPINYWLRCRLAVLHDLVTQMEKGTILESPALWLEDQVSGFKEACCRKVCNPFEIQRFCKTLYTKIFVALYIASYVVLANFVENIKSTSQD